MNKSIAILSGYGAFEIKRAYRRNMSIGMIVSSLFFLTAVGGAVLINNLTNEPPKPVGTIVLSPSIVLDAPPIISVKDVPIRVFAPERAAPSLGVPYAVPNDEASEEVEYATLDELAEMTALSPKENWEDFKDKEIIISNDEELLPSETAFIAYEEPPMQVEIVKPLYPEMARRAGIEGSVWVNVLLDKEGKVRDVKIKIDSGANAGFEEAAIKAAKQTSWKPAISNGQPVALWVSYKITFTLK